MSKSKGNVVDIWEMIGKYGADPLRWYFYTVNQPFDDKLFSEREVKEALRRFILTLLNSFLFFETYGLQFSRSWESRSRSENKNILDRWIISKLNELIFEVTESLNNYDVTGAARNIENFVIEDLSQWYIRRSRKRFQRPETKKELKEASKTLNFVLSALIKLTAPFIPFFSEEIYQKIKSKVYGLKFHQSIHLENWPRVDKRLIKKDLNKKMDQVRKIVSLGLKARRRAKIKVRQSLSKLKIKEQKARIDRKLFYLIKDELNVKEIETVKKVKKEKDWIIESEAEAKIALNTKITPELREEGMVREVVRQIQDMRKKAGLKPKNKISVYYLGTPNLNNILAKNKDFILRETRAREFQRGKRPKLVVKIEQRVKIDGEELWLALKKLK